MIAAPSGSTGNNTHASLRIHPAAQKLALVLIVENGGATPAISWKVQGALDVDSVADGSANWVDLALMTAASDSLAAIPIVISSATTGTVSAVWHSTGAAKANPPRFYRRVRAVTSANTNVTYRIEATQHVP